VPDHIEAGKTEIGALAAATGADTDSLQRVLQHLVSKGVFEEPEPGRFALNDAARELMTEGSRLVFNLDSLGGRMAHAWGTLLSAVRTGKPAYHEVFGRTFWEDLDAHPQIAADFDALMGPAGHGVPDPQVLVDGTDWTAIRTVVDVGGGAGWLLAEILRAHPHVRGTLVDLPRAVARSAEVFEKAGVADRATAVAQSFFDPLPAAGDVYVLKNVLGDWPDAEAQAILRRCAEAARPSGRVVTFGPGDKASPELLMLVLVGGRGRSLEDFRKLAQGAGLEVTAVGQQESGRSIVECRPM
jgi:2,7-dihydroxy-5-methyl-1-naphthoate 7-O-methyltransferase